MLALIPYFEQFAWPDPPWFGVLAVRGFGLMIVLAILIGWQPLKWRARQRGLSIDDTSDFVFTVVVVGFIGSHLFDVVFYHPWKLREDPLILFKIWDGISSLGGWISGMAGAWLFFRWRTHLAPKAWAFIDALSYAWPLAWLIARGGCALAHDHPGIPATSSTWLAVNFPPGVLGPGHPGGPHHDLGLYEMVYMVLPCLAFALFTGLERRRGQLYHPGFYLGALLVLYAPVRFCLDFLRLVDRRYFIPINSDTAIALTPAHFMSVMMLGVGVAVLICRPGRDLPNHPPSCSHPNKHR